MDDFWGQDIDRAYVGIRCKITSSNLTIMKSNTLKISLNNNISLIKFNATDDEIEQLSTQGWIEIDAYCKCNCNEWNGNSYPQLIIEDDDDYLLLYDSDEAGTTEESSEEGAEPLKYRLYEVKR